MPPIVVKDRFEVDSEAVLGEGAFGSVVRAIDRANGGRHVACKIISTAQFTREAIELECCVLESVRDHPNIVELVDYHHDNERAVAYVIMELVPGRELFELVTGNTSPQGRLSEATARPLFLELVHAVAHCHNNGVAHRDLKLDNVLITPEGGLKLLDFGLAAQIDPTKKCTNGSWDDSGWKDVCGTRPYAAPEVLRANAGYGCFAADVWSLGICLFAMCGGFFPLDEATQRDWRFARLKYEVRCGKSAVHVIHSFYSRECTWSAPLVALVNSMLVADPCERASLDAVLHSEWLTTDHEETMSTAPTMVADSPEGTDRLVSDLHGWQLAHGALADESHPDFSTGPAGTCPSSTHARTDAPGVDEDEDDDMPQARFCRALPSAGAFDILSTDSVPEVHGMGSSYNVVFRGPGRPAGPTHGPPAPLRRCAAFRGAITARSTEETSS